MKDNHKIERNGVQVMAGLIGMVYPLLGIMAAAVLMGSLGNLMASFITISGSVLIGRTMGLFPQISSRVLVIVIVVFAVLRGILRYAEQASNHYIAFKLLARIRHRVFLALRQLAPAKLEGAEKGNLISIITSDIELLEVFYAHTISPIAIAVITSLVMIGFIGQFHWSLGVFAGICYLITGLLIPVVNSKMGQKYGREYRRLYGRLNTAVLDNLYGMNEILQYRQKEERMDKMNAYTKELEKVNHILKTWESFQRILTDSVILAAGIIMLLLSAGLSRQGVINGGEVMICTVAVMSSFGPTASLSALSNNLNQTLASGNRVLDLLKETPMVREIHSNVMVPDGDIQARNVTFSYKKGDQREDVALLNNLSAVFEKNKITGILGRSGCGKSTLLKLLMRFYETDAGAIEYGGRNVNDIDTKALRKHIAYVTQETFLFQDTIENNIKLANPEASREEVETAARKASIHEFICSLPLGYDTKLGALGESLSGGERQRIGIARAFLHNSDVILLDEPTSNIDSLNEGIILKSLSQVKEDKTIVLVSHRKSTMGIADHVIS